jgi:hypothetical protein
VPKLSFKPPASAAVIVIGKPRWNVAIPLTCQPPTSAFLSPLASLAIFSPFPKGRL